MSTDYYVYCTLTVHLIFSFWYDFLKLKLNLPEGVLPGNWMSVCKTARKCQYGDYACINYSNKCYWLIDWLTT